MSFAEIAIADPFLVFESVHELALIYVHRDPNLYFLFREHTIKKSRIKSITLNFVSDSYMVHSWCTEHGALIHPVGKSQLV